MAIGLINEDTRSCDYSSCRVFCLKSMRAQGYQAEEFWGGYLSYDSSSAPVWGIAANKALLLSLRV